MFQGFLRSIGSHKDPLDFNELCAGFLIPLLPGKYLGDGQMGLAHAGADAFGGESVMPLGLGEISLFEGDFSELEMREARYGSPILDGLFEPVFSLVRL